MSLPALTDSTSSSVIGADLTPKQRALAEHLVSSNDTVADAAEATGISRGYAYKTVAREDFARYLHARVSETFGVASGRALHTLLSLLEADSEGVRLRAAADILDRAGHKPVEKKAVALRGHVTVDIAW